MAKLAAEHDSTASKYQILRKLAVGGMAEIFLARGASVAGVERYCVLKRILDDHARDAVLVQMFVDEARLAAQLQHPNIASVYDFGTLGDSYFFTMEYVHGETVRSLVDRVSELHRPLPLACVLTIIAGAASGLHHAHERKASDGRPLGIVHRDVSPSNLMVSYEGHVKVVDFGVAKAADRANETKAGTVKGKIGYLSPEQCRGAPLDRRSDLFSLGIVMWEMLTARRLYRREGNFENMAAIVNEPTTPPSAFRPDLPREVDDLVLRLLAKSPAARFQSAADVVEAIEQAAVNAGSILSSSAVSRLVRELFGTRPEPWLEPTPEAALADAVTTANPPISDDLEVVELGVSSLIDLSAELRDDPDDANDAATGALAQITAAMLPSDPAHRPVSANGEVVSATPMPVPASPSPEDAPTVVVAPIEPEPVSDRFVATAVMTRAPDIDVTSSAIEVIEEIEVVSPSAELTPLMMPHADPYGLTAPGPRRAPPRGAAQPPWPLLAVIATALVVGVGVAWLAMHRTRPRGSAPDGSALVVDPTTPVAGSAAPQVAPIVEPAPRVGSGSAQVTAPPPQASFEELSAHYEARDYQSVVTACSRAATTTGITTICMMAACHLGDAVQARRWLAAHPAARRSQLAASCERFGHVKLDASGAPPPRR